MGCTHPTAAITDHAVHGYEGAKVRYAWRGTCLECRRGVVGVTALPPTVSGDVITAALTDDLQAYLSYVATSTGS